MSYFKAKQCLDENRGLIGQPNQHEDMLIWNLSTGLINLTDAIEADMARLSAQLNQIAQALARQSRP